MNLLKPWKKIGKEKKIRGTDRGYQGSGGVNDYRIFGGLRGEEVLLLYSKFILLFEK